MVTIIATNIIVLNNLKIVINRLKPGGANSAAISFNGSISIHGSKRFVALFFA